jgi:acetyl-CoA acetyltransferase
VIDEQDHFALRSHRMAAIGTDDGRLAAEIVPVYVPPKYATVLTSDNGIRRDTSIEQMRALNLGMIEDNDSELRHAITRVDYQNALNDHRAAFLINEHWVEHLYAVFSTRALARVQQIQEGRHAFAASQWT